MSVKIESSVAHKRTEKNAWERTDKRELLNKIPIALV